MTERQLSSEVAIVGGGPTGLALALFLDSYGVRSVVFNTEPTTRWHPKGNTHNQRTMEHFRRFGLAEGIRNLGMPWDHPIDVAYFTRLSAFEVARFKVPSKRERLAALAHASVTDQISEPMHRVNQMYMERFLLERARERRNIAVRFGWEAEGFSQDAAGVTLGVRETGASRTETWRTHYLVGCDGGRSTIRKALGIRYDGEDALKDVFMVGEVISIHMRIPALYDKFVGHRCAWMYLTVNPDTRGVIISLNGKDEFMMHKPAKAGEVINEAEVIKTVQRAIGADIPVEIVGHRPWYAGGFLVAQRFAEARVLLAGDAVHLFTPNGGFGLNTGIDDVANLSWKLAAVLQGWGGKQLIDSYEAERRPVAIRNTNAGRQLGKAWHDIHVTKVIEEVSPAGEQARAEAARSSFVVDNHFVQPEEQDSLGVVLGARYDGSPLIVADGPPPEDTLATYSPSSLPGGRAPHLWIEHDGSRKSLYDLFGMGFTLLRLSDASPDTTEMERYARARRIPLKVVTLNAHEARQFYSRELTLIRPDQHVAWRGDVLPADIDGVLAQLTGNGCL